MHPDMKKRIPANFSGVVYCNPILIATKAVAQRKQATIAKKIVWLKSCFFNELSPLIE